MSSSSSGGRTSTPSSSMSRNDSNAPSDGSVRKAFRHHLRKVDSRIKQTGEDQKPIAYGLHRSASWFHRFLSGDRNKERLNNIEKSNNTEITSSSYPFSSDVQNLGDVLSELLEAPNRNDGNDKVLEVIKDMKDGKVDNARIAFEKFSDI